jgi:L,D-peptidoglycan transpeptidase YkuD (ErfK/YbiS/YcfS/YnhG family)
MGNIRVLSSGKIIWDNKEHQCALGIGGVVMGKKEGDGATPAGCFAIREVMYRSDRIVKPKTNIPISELRENDGWCNEGDDPNYNKKVALPYPAIHEALWRVDDLYDIIVVLGYNDAPVEKFKGSAIFMHIAKPDYQPTIGCIALAKEDLIDFLREVSKDTQICIT